MLRDGRPGGGRYERRRCGDVERPGAVTARSRRVHEVVARRRDGNDVRAHRLRAAGDLVCRLPLGAERDEEARGLGLRRLAGHDLVHRRPRSRGVQVLPGQQLGDGLLYQRELSRKFLQQIAAQRQREHRLGVELHAVDRQCAVPHAHHLAVLGARRHLELVGDARRRERVVAPGAEALRQAGEDPAAVVLDLRRLSVQQPLGLRDLAAEGLDDRLVAEADAERRRRGGQAADDVQRGTRLPGPSGPRRDDEVRWGELACCVRVDLVVAQDDDFAAELLQQVREVVGEAVVVVHEQDLHLTASARLSAVSSAASLRRHSSCSACGLESATTPAPACR